MRWLCAVFLHSVTIFVQVWARSDNDRPTYIVQSLHIVADTDQSGLNTSNCLHWCVIVK